MRTATSDSRGDYLGSKLIYNPKSWGNSKVAVTYSSPDDDAVGLILRYVDSRNYYRFSVDQSRHTARIVRVEDGEVTLLAERDFDIVHAGGHTLEFLAYEKTLGARVDGDWVLLLFEETDSPNFVGRAGIYEWWLADAVFDNFRVEPL